MGSKGYTCTVKETNSSFPVHWLAVLYSHVFWVHFCGRAGVRACVCDLSWLLFWCCIIYTRCYFDNLKISLITLTLTWTDSKWKKERKKASSNPPLKGFLVGCLTSFPSAIRSLVEFRPCTCSLSRVRRTPPFRSSPTGRMSAWPHLVTAWTSHC